MRNDAIDEITGDTGSEQSRGTGMRPSKVWFTDLRTRPGHNLLDKTEALMRAGGIATIDFKDKFVALKLHLGEPGNIAYIRPNYVARVVKLVRDLGGKPFLTDCNTLYTGGRSNAVDHLLSAQENGFNRIAVGADIIIADGLKGTDYREIPIHLKRCDTAKIGTVIADADIIISLTHFKGHEQAGFGGTLKNIGMGSGSRGGKMQMHSESKPRIDVEHCVACGMCIRSCAQTAIAWNADHKAAIDYAKCVGCGQCVAVCMYDAARPVFEGTNEALNEKIAEYAYAVLHDKPAFHVSFIMSVSPNCDCWSSNDAAIVPDIGIAASFDPVALDQACVDLVNKAVASQGSVLADAHFECGDKFTFVHPDTHWESQVQHAEEIGLGTRQYELIVV
jgi:uncharacterized Fe-S center protein